MPGTYFVKYLKTIRSFIHSFICSFICLLIYLFIHSFIHSFIHLIIHSFLLHSFIHNLSSFANGSLLTCEPRHRMLVPFHLLQRQCTVMVFIHSLRSFVHSFLPSFIHLFIYLLPSVNGFIDPMSIAIECSCHFLTCSLTPSPSTPEEVVYFIFIFISFHFHFHLLFISFSTSSSVRNSGSPHPLLT
jgi:hypothetical protein